MARSPESYRSDVEFLAAHTDVIELAGEGTDRVAVAPEYQGRVMTSALAGESGAGFGWINRAFIEAGQESPTFNNYGGEDRFWLGPEAGPFALWFRTGEPFDTAHWRTPSSFGSGPFHVEELGRSSVALSRSFEVTNYAGTTFSCRVRRTIRCLTVRQVSRALGADVKGLAAVAFESDNELENAGSSAWTRPGGLLSLWILGMFRPLPHGKVIVPLRPAEEKTPPDAGVTTDYFGPLPPDRCRGTDRCILFSCDGKYRSKIGVAPARARDVLGSYDPDARVLTIAQFNLPPDADRRPYVSSLWKMHEAPFAGDVVNSYNDGEERPGAGQLGPFYELETSSPAAELSPARSIRHVHRTMHFAGEEAALSALARKVLGVDVSQASGAALGTFLSTIRFGGDGRR